MSKFTELFEGQELSEGFKDQAEAIMQTAINEAVEAKTTEIEEAKETFITEKTKELSEAADAYLEDILKPSINEKADEYITYAVTKWKEDNKLQLESGAKVEIAESFMKGLKELFEAHNVSIPEGSEDALAEAEKKVEATEAKLNEAIEHGIKLTKEVEKLTRKAVVESACKELTETQVEKIETVSANLVFEDAESFEENVKGLIKTHFGESKDEDMEDDDEVDEADKKAKKAKDKKEAIKESYMDKLMRQMNDGQI